MSFQATGAWDRPRRLAVGSHADLGCGGRSTEGRKRRRDSRPSLEALEDRIALATFFVVNALDGPGSGPAGSLRSAITQATLSASGTNRVVITSGVTGPINLSAGELGVATSLAIENESGHEVVICQQQPGERVLEIGAGASKVTISGSNPRSPITIEGGSVTNANANGGGILISGAADLTLTFVRVTSNTVANGDGGGIYAQAGTITLVGSSVTQNLAPRGSGGGIYVQKGSVILRAGSHVDENSALDIGGIGVNSGPGVFENAVELLSGSSASRNSSTATVNPATQDFGGGGVAVQGPGSVFISGSQVSDNHTVGMYSGGILVTLGNAVVTNGSQIDRNTNRGPGGGIAANFLGSVIVTGHSQVNQNTGAALGGGIVDFGTGAQPVSIEGGSQVNNNILTNAESIGGALIAFLELIAGSLGMSYQSLTGLTPQQSVDLIGQVEAEIANAHGVDPSTIAGRVVAGGGIGTLLGARVQIESSSSVAGNYAGRMVTNVVSVGVGGGVATLLSRADIDQGAVNNNIATEDGGGIWSRRDMRITRSTISHNNALGQTLGALGGGLFLGSLSRNTLILDSAIRDNSAEFGGGCFNLGTITVQGSSISRNRATEEGGGIANSGQLTVVGSGVTYNIATLSGGGISNHGQLTVRHSHIAANAPDNISPA